MKKTLVVLAVIIGGLVLFGRVKKQDEGHKQDLDAAERVVECHMCHGDGVCYHCNGDGFRNGRRCSVCNGTGDCDACTGDGSIEVLVIDGKDYTVCTTCHGSGACGVCNGTGELSYQFSTLDHVGGECSLCHGSGNCLSCKGSGLRELAGF